MPKNQLPFSDYDKGILCSFSRVVVVTIFLGKEDSLMSDVNDNDFNFFDTGRLSGTIRNSASPESPPNDDTSYSTENNINNNNNSNNNNNNKSNNNNVNFEGINTSFTEVTAAPFIAPVIVPKDEVKVC